METYTGTDNSHKWDRTIRRARFWKKAQQYAFYFLVIDFTAAVVTYVVATIYFYGKIVNG